MSIFESVRCIVFDIDDTLYLERDYARSGFEAVGKWVEQRFDVSGFGSRAWRAFEDGSRGTIFNEVLEALDMPYSRDLIRQMVDVYRSHSPKIELLGDSRDLLSAVDDGYKLAALTGGPPESQRAKVAALDLDERLSPIIYAGSWGADFDKPHARAFQKLENESGYSGQACIYLADNPAKDFTAPRKLGWKTVRVRRAGSLHEDVASGKVDLEVSQLSELKNLI